jgi:hypothetical protein
MIFTEDKKTEYFEGKKDVDEKSVGSCDSHGIYKVEKEGKDLINMIKLFNKQARKAGIYDIDAALIPSPSKLPTPSNKHLLSSPMKKTPSTARAGNRGARRVSVAVTPFTPKHKKERRTSLDGNKLAVLTETKKPILRPFADQKRDFIQSSPNLDKIGPKFKG